MIFKTFSVFDDKANCFMPPFFQHNAAMAERVFADACRTPDHPFHLNHEDYTLYEIGTFDDAAGSLGAIPIQMIVSATSVLSITRKLDIVENEKGISTNG